MKGRIALLRGCYWFGAAFDAAMIIPMLSPSIAARLFGLEGLHPGVEYRYAMFIGASLMAGWTALLVWADRRPVERRAVLVLTVFPVVCGLAAAGAFAVWEGLITPGRMLPTWIVQAAIGITFTHAYVAASGGERAEREP